MDARENQIPPTAPSATTRRAWSGPESFTPNTASANQATGTSANEATCAPTPQTSTTTYAKPTTESTPSQATRQSGLRVPRAPIGTSVWDRVPHAADAEHPLQKS